MKSQKKYLLLLSILLLCILSACGKKEIQVLDYGGSGENHYTVTQETPKNLNGIPAADSLDGVLHYITYQTYETNYPLHPTVLASISGENGDALTWQSLRRGVDGLAERQGVRLDKISAISVQSDGGALLSADVCKGDGEDVDIDDVEFYSQLIALSGEHTVRWSIDLPETFSYAIAPELCQDKDGYAYALSAAGALLVLDGDGKQVLYEQNGYQHLARRGDGAVLLFRLAVDGTQWEVLLPDWTTETKTLLCTLPLLQEGDTSSSRFYTGNGWFDLYCVTDLSLYGIQLNKNGKVCAVTQILSWMNYDIDGTAILALSPCEGKSFAVLSDSTDFGVETIHLQWEKKNIANEKTTVTLACRQLSTNLSRLIRQFNRQNSDCRVVIRDYGSAQTTGIDRLTVDLNAGNMPDIFYLEDIDEQILINRGYLEDLWPYIDADDQLGRDALVQPLFNAMSIGDKLYTITNGFQIQTTLGLKALVGEEPGWSFAEFTQLVQNTDDLKTINAYYTRENALESQLINLYAQQFVDWENGTATFDSPAFIEVMEYLKLYPEDVDRSILQAEDFRYSLAEGKRLLLTREIESCRTYDTMRISYVGSLETAVWKGFPRLPGNGSAFRLQTPLAMTSSSKNKEAAWSFLRTLLLPGNQDFERIGLESVDNCLPANQTMLDEMVQNYITDDLAMVEFDGEVSPGLAVVNPYGVNVYLTPWTQEDIDAFYALIEGATVVVRPQEMIAGILRDEITRFFAGQQDAPTAAKAIQNRVQLCLDEQS